jgi:hypothetical protein
MSANFKLASQLKLRFNTTRGNLSTEQLWDLSLDDLDTLAVDLEKLTKEGVQKSFLAKRTDEDKISKLQFDIALEILQTKVEENEIALNAKSVKEHNEKILALIADKREEGLKGKSIEELQDLLK